MGLLGRRISDSLLISIGSTTNGAMVAWLSTCCSTPGVSTIEEYKSSSASRLGKKKGVPVFTWPQMNMSSVASEICLLPCATFARTPTMIFSLGTSICGLRSGTQNWQRRPQPVVISTTPKVVRRSGIKMPSREVGWETLASRGRVSPRIALRKSSRVSADSLRPSTTQSTPSVSKLFVWVICQPPEPPTITLRFFRNGWFWMRSNIWRA